MANRKRKTKAKKFTPPKVKVPKRDFDKVLSGLIQAQPQPEKRLK